MSYNQKIKQHNNIDQNGQHSKNNSLLRELLNQTQKGKNFAKKQDLETDKQRYHRKSNSASKYNASLVKRNKLNQSLQRDIGQQVFNDNFKSSTGNVNKSFSYLREASKLGQTGNYPMIFDQEDYLNDNFGILEEEDPLQQELQNLPEEQIETKIKQDGPKNINLSLNYSGIKQYQPNQGSVSAKNVTIRQQQQKQQKNLQNNSQKQNNQNRNLTQPLDSFEGVPLQEFNKNNTMRNKNDQVIKVNQFFERTYSSGNTAANQNLLNQINTGNINNNDPQQQITLQMIQQQQKQQLDQQQQILNQLNILQTNSPNKNEQQNQSQQQYFKNQNHTQSQKQELNNQYDSNNNQNNNSLNQVFNMDEFQVQDLDSVIQMIDQCTYQFQEHQQIMQMENKEMEQQKLQADNQTQLLQLEVDEKNQLIENLEAQIKELQSQLIKKNNMNGIQRNQRSQTLSNIQNNNPNQMTNEEIQPFLQVIENLNNENQSIKKENASLKEENEKYKKLFTAIKNSSEQKNNSTNKNQPPQNKLQNYEKQLQLHNQNQNQYPDELNLNHSQKQVNSNKQFQNLHPNKASNISNRSKQKQNISQNQQQLSQKQQQQQQQVQYTNENNYINDSVKKELNDLYMKNGVSSTINNNMNNNVNDFYGTKQNFANNVLNNTALLQQQQEQINNSGYLNNTFNGRYNNNVINNSNNDQGAQKKTYKYIKPKNQNFQ
ncbi:hypothetical protein PPERSA_09383 [Pseudocohnilembus persalinus]|uniref:Uncharacterized protein n=1 Tax=Pseudocohnilembus persalinus TaxID=266149 RepID=A0A0V0QLX6_PSEPJ|nr:hypothetical protein PPERSA_09383 [Pseudocohnilembus persalinus]|eukprot:KRX02965.1 hypothetical protein PPERSA_09383 [Pseudocohnilembus persalinus]